MSKLLTNREIIVDFKDRVRTSDVLIFLEDNYKSVEYVTFVDTTSSAGDWGGVIVQRTSENKCVAIIFSMENMYPNNGFRVLTDDVFYNIPSGKEFDLETICNIFKEKNCLF